MKSWVKRLSEISKEDKLCLLGIIRVMEWRGALPLLIAMHKYEDETISLSALATIGEVGGPAARKYLLQVLNNTSPSQLSWVLVNALNQRSIAKDEDCKMLLDLWECPEVNYDVKCSTIHGLISRLSYKLERGEKPIENETLIKKTQKILNEVGKVQPGDLDIALAELRSILHTVKNLREENENRDNNPKKIATERKVIADD
jgi:hypothetical protein